MQAWGSAEGINLQTGIVSQYPLMRHRPAVILSFLSHVFFEGCSVFHDLGQRRKPWNLFDCDAMRCDCPSEITHLACVRCRHQNCARLHAAAPALSALMPCLFLRSSSGIISVIIRFSYL